MTLSLFSPPLPAAIGSIYLLTWACGETPWRALNYSSGGCFCKEAFPGAAKKSLSLRLHPLALDPSLQRELV